VKGEAPARGRDPDAELEALAQERYAADIRPLTEDEMRVAARGLFQTDNAFSGSVVRSDLAGGGVPLAEADQYPCPEFGLSDRGTLIFRVRRSAQQVDRWRVVTDGDKDKWSTSFRLFIENQLALVDARLAHINASSSWGRQPVDADPVSGSPLRNPSGPEEQG
jgi:hypothetical protein